LRSLGLGRRLEDLEAATGRAGLDARAGFFLLEALVVCAAPRDLGRFADLTDFDRPAAGALRAAGSGLPPEGSGEAGRSA
jgi:hypothetical protein